MPALSQDILLSNWLGFAELIDFKKTSDFIFAFSISISVSISSLLSSALDNLVKFLSKYIRQIIFRATYVAKRLIEIRLSCNPLLSKG